MNLSYLVNKFSGMADAYPLSRRGAIPGGGFGYRRYWLLHGLTEVALGGGQGVLPHVAEGFDAA